MGHLQHVYESYKKKGVVVLGFNTADSKEKTAELLKEKGVTYPNILDPSAAVRRIATEHYRSSSVPMNYVIDREGRIAAAFSGYAEGDTRGVDAIEEILAGRSPAALSRRASVYGTVSGPGGKPLGGTYVTLLPAGGRGSYQGTTDADGRYGVTEVPPGEYRMLVQLVAKQGFSCPAGRVTVTKDGGVERNIRLPDTSISGTILRKDNKTPFHPRDISIFAGSYYATPDEHGRYRLVGLPPGTYEVRINSSIPSIRDAKRTVDLAGDHRKGVDFDLETMRTGRMRLRVTGADGKPARGLEFRLDLGEGSSVNVFPREVADGVYVFELEVGGRRIFGPARTFSVRANIPDGKTVEREIDLRE
jgi:hypothetical protein